jgi:hypothetical protein
MTGGERNYIIIITGGADHLSSLSPPLLITDVDENFPLGRFEVYHITIPRLLISVVYN